MHLNHCSNAETLASFGERCPAALKEVQAKLEARINAAAQ